MQGLPGIIIKDEQSKTDRNFAIAPTHKSDSVLQEDFQISSDKIPKTLTATMIEFLINDPWQFCLKYVLKVKEIKDIDKKPSYAEFGNLVHNTLQHCKLGTTSEAILTEIFDQYAKKYYQNLKYV